MFVRPRREVGEAARRRSAAPATARVEARDVGLERLAQRCPGAASQPRRGDPPRLIGTPGRHRTRRRPARSGGQWPLSCRASRRRLARSGSYDSSTSARRPVGTNRSRRRSTSRKAAREAASHQRPKWPRARRASGVRGDGAASRSMPIMSGASESAFTGAKENRAQERRASGPAGCRWRRSRTPLPIRFPPCEPDDRPRAFSRPRRAPAPG